LSAQAGRLNERPMAPVLNKRLRRESCIRDSPGEAGGSGCGRLGEIRMPRAADRFARCVPRVVLLGTATSWTRLDAISCDFSWGRCAHAPRCRNFPHSRILSRKRSVSRVAKCRSRWVTQQRHMLLAYEVLVRTFLGRTAGT